MNTKTAPRSMGEQLQDLSGALHGKEGSSSAPHEGDGKIEKGPEEGSHTATAQSVAPPEQSQLSLVETVPVIKKNRAPQQRPLGSFSVLTFFTKTLSEFLLKLGNKEEHNVIFAERNGTGFDVLEILVVQHSLGWHSPVIAIGQATGKFSSFAKHRDKMIYWFDFVENFFDPKNISCSMPLSPKDAEQYQLFITQLITVTKPIYERMKAKGYRKPPYRK